MLAWIPNIHLLHEHWICIECVNLFLVEGIVKKCGLFKIVHEKHKKNTRNNESAVEEFVHSFDFAAETNKELASLVSKVQVIAISLLI